MCIRLLKVKEVKESFEKLTLRKVNNWKPDEVKAAKSIGNKKKSKKVSYSNDKQ